MPGVNLWSLNTGLRYASYHNKGGAGTSGASATQGTMNWKVSTVFEPFDFVRFRLTRSRDLRAAGYRDLFLNQPGLPDQLSGVNPWRERSAFSDENQTERFGQVRVGNPDLKPEQSNTLTIGLVLSPGGWAQGMRMSVDYYNIKVKNGINTPFNAERPYTACWEDSGNVPALYLVDGEVNPDQPGINGLIDMSLPSCQEITFATNEDGSRDLTDIVSYNSARPQNSLPIQRRGLDLSWSYMFPLTRAFESLPGSVSLNIQAQRALEASGVRQQSSATGFTGTNPDECGRAYEEADPFNHPASNPTFIGNRYTCVDLVGQIRSAVFIPGVAASPEWTGTIRASYILGDLTATLSARYIGGAKLDVTWSDDPSSPLYRNAAGQLLNGSVDNNTVKPYFNYSLNGSYNLKVADMKQFQVFGSINNLLNKSPPFTGGGVSGASAQYHDTMGRAYRMGVRLKF
jgi:outer membrane receptor protein involved in Fe transport